MNQSIARTLQSFTLVVEQGAMQRATAGKSLQAHSDTLAGALYSFSKGSCCQALQHCPVWASQLVSSSGFSAYCQEM